MSEGAGANHEPHEVSWDPPGPGTWICDRSHGRPGFTPLWRRIVNEHTAPTYRSVLETFGAPLGTIDMTFVNGSMYRRLVPLIAPDRDTGKPPPTPLLWLAVRLHPEMRRRERIAQKALDDKTFLDDVRHWLVRDRFEWIAENRRLQAVDPARLDDAELADHLGGLDRRLVEGWCRHHHLHGNDLGPIGDLLAHTDEWGLDPVDVMRCLEGASPATVESRQRATAIATALRAAGVDPASITSREEIEAVPEAAAALADYLDLFGWRLVSDYDLEGLTLGEMPAAVVGIVVRVARQDADQGDKAATEQLQADLRAQSPDPGRFDDLVGDARAAYGVRDDNGPLTWQWPAGLTRRAYLEAGRRLADRGRIGRPELAFDADIPELQALLVGGGPSDDELAARHEQRDWERSLTGPDVLGPPPVEPDLAPLTPGIRRLMKVILTAVTKLEPEPRDDEFAVSERERVGAAPAELSGTGIGDRPHIGIARVATDPIHAIETLEPGDVLVAAFTAPSFNAVFAMAGGVVVQEGGLLCHAAVMARELDIPTVVGCAGAMTAVHDGDRIEVDPLAGRVRVLERS